ncbi:MAG: hypothetical protein AABM32_07250 [Chloroflexota bacterium]
MAVAATPARADSGPLSRTISIGGTTTPSGARPAGTGNFVRPEIAKAEGEEAAGAAAKTNRSMSKKKGNPIPVVTPTAVDGTAPGKLVNFQGLNHRDQRTANGGNQFSLEPPDQGLCVGNGYVLETVNDVLRFWSTAGAALTGVIDQNTFYGYPAQFNRTTGAQGPFITDPSCLYDPDTQRWFHVVLTLDVVPDTGEFTGTNHLDLAVSRTPDPTGMWNIYRIPVQDDGTAGTPNHHCSGGPCIGDFPHIGADEYGFYITTNEYSFFGPEFISAQLYAISKAKLALGFTTVTVHQFDKLKIGGGPGFTVWPAVAPAGLDDLTRGGTEYFLSSMAGEEAGNKTGIDSRIGLWALTNTSSLDNAHPDLNLTTRVIDSQTYAVPKPSNQKPGDFPLGQCINDTTMATPFGPGCWQFLFVDEPAHNEVESHLDSSDTRMMQVVYAGGLLYGALDTAVIVSGQEKAGIAWFVIRPSASGRDGIKGEIVSQGYLAVAGNNVTYPAIAVRPDGKGVIAFTLVGTDYYPTAGYVTFSATTGTSSVHVAERGLGPSDGFTSYKAFVGDPPRTRWGDYGAAAVDGTSIWIASEYIAQTCTLTQYATAPFGSCGATRTALANWSTRVTQVALP